MDDLLNITGKIAGIGGLAIGVFLLLFKEVIRKNIFQILSKEKSYKIIQLFLWLVWSIAILGITLWFFTTYKSNLELSTPSYEGNEMPKKIDIIDIAYKTSKELDIKVLNRTKETLFIKNIEIMVKDINYFRVCLSANYPLYSSENYDVTLPEKEVPYSEIVNVSQILEPNKADRFTLTINTPPNYVYFFDLSLIYNNDKKSTFEKNLIAFIKDPRDIYCSADDENYSAIKHNKDLTKKIKSHDVIKSKYLVEFIDGFQKSL